MTKISPIAPLNENHNTCRESLSHSRNCFVFHRYGFTLDKLICLGYIQHPEMAKGGAANARHIVTNDFIMSRNARYEIDIAGQRFMAKPHIHAPHIPHVNMESASRRYRPTVASLKAN